MGEEPFPDDVRRFILTSIPSVPHLEALLLVREERAREWDSATLARRLYVDLSTAENLLGSMLAAGLLAEGSAPGRYRWAPASPELARMIDRLAEVYAKRLVEVTNLIHSEVQKKAQRFSDAFRWRKDT
jgi:hypothetical protein